MRYGKLNLDIADYDLIDEIADKYVTSVDDYDDYLKNVKKERDEIASTFNISLLQANKIMIGYLGFDPSEIDSLPINGEIDLD